MSLPVFLAEGEPLEPGALVALAGAEGRHAAGAKRLRVGEGLELVDGRGRRARCRVEALDGKQGLTALVEDAVDEPAPSPRVTLVQALPKHERSELAVDLATQAGVGEIVPWQAERCVARWSGPKAKKGREKWLATAREVAKQSRRSWLPGVAEPLSTGELEDRVAEAAGRGAAVFLLHEDADAPLTRAAGEPRGEAWFLVGPEGGIGEDEASGLIEAGATPVRLGREVVRTAAAGVVAISALRALWDAW